MSTFSSRSKKIIAGLLAVIALLAIVNGVTYYSLVGAPAPVQTFTQTVTATAGQTVTQTAKPFRIVMISSGGPDNSWIISIRTGLDQAVAYLDNKLGRHIELDYVYSVSYGDIESVLEKYAASGYDLIVPADGAFEEAVYVAAPRFPNVQFLGTGYYGKLAPNVGDASSDLWEAYFPAGVVAGLMTKTNILGFVSAFSFGQVNQALNAFLAGAKLANPKVTKIVYSFTQDWHDPVKGGAAASALIAAGADVLTGMGNGMTDGLIKQCEGAGVYAVGYLYDENSLAPKTVLTSVMYNFTSYAIPSILYAMVGQLGFKRTVLHLSAASYIAPFHGTLPPEVEAKANEIIKKMYAGEIAVPVNDKLPE